MNDFELSMSNIDINNVTLDEAISFLEININYVESKKMFEKVKSKYDKEQVKSKTNDYVLITWETINEYYNTILGCVKRLDSKNHENEFNRLINTLTISIDKCIQLYVGLKNNVPFEELDNEFQEVINKLEQLFLFNIYVINIDPSTRNEMLGGGTNE